MITIIVNNNSSILKTDNKKLLKTLAKKYSAKVPGYNYSAAYKNRGWNGEKAFFSAKTGKFGSGLISHIVEDLTYLGLDHTIEDLRDGSHSDDISLPGITLREYQESMVLKALEAKGCIIKAPTGAGKTLILGGILKALEGQTGLIFFTKKQLLKQTYDTLREWGIDVGLAFGDGVILKPMTLCTVQSIDKVIDTHLKTSDFIIFDEVHEFAKGKVATKVIKSFPNATYRIGMTATVPRDPMSRLNLISGLGPVIEEVDAKGLIEEGFLTEPLIQIIPMKDTGTVEDTELSYREVYEKFVTENDMRNDMIVELAEKIQKNQSRTLIIVKDLKHAEILHERIPNSFKLEGKDDLATRKKTINAFKDDKMSVLIGTTIMQTGIDIPEITHLINARGLKSEIATLQALGRALRIHKSKNQVFIYDFFDRAPYLEKHAKERIKSYESLGLEITHEK
jgi:superfamily II DNA or RNA helicase